MPNSVLLLDNATFHHQHEFIALMQRAGVELIFLTPYDPRCAPIERANNQVPRALPRLPALLLCCSGG